MSTVRIRDTIYIFIDAANFRRYFEEVTSKWADVPANIDYRRISTSYGAKKLFYYDCINDLYLQDETVEAFRRRLDRQESEIAKIRSLEDTHVKLGSMSGSYKNRRQKGVDIALAVDMLRHAERGNMNTALLMSGDGDFRPLVEALVEMGLSAWVSADKNHTSQELRLAADRYTPLDLIKYFGWADSKFREKHPLPGQISGLAYMRNENYQQIGKGSVGENPAWLYTKPGSIGIMMDSVDGQPLNVYFGDYKKLKLFCELCYGPTSFDVEP